MAATAWRTYDNGLLAIANKTIDLDTDSFKIALFTSSYSPNTTTDDLYSSLSNEVSSTNTGYTTGGIALTMSALSVASHVIKWTTATSIVWTAGSAGLTCRTAVIYHVGTSKLIAYCILDSTPADVSISSGGTLTITPNASGILTITGATT